MLKFVAVIIFNILFTFSFAQSTRSVNPGKSRKDISAAFLKGHPKIKRCVKKNFIPLEGNFIMGNFSGSDSVNISPFLRRVVVGLAYLSKKEVSVEDYMLFFNENEGIYKTLNLTPSADRVDELPDDFLQSYIKDPKNSDYPIVGISKAQATAYLEWTTQKMLKEYNQNGSSYMISYRLPVNAELQLAEIKAFETGKKKTNFVEVTETGEKYERYSNYKKNGQKEMKFPFSKVTENVAPKLDFYNLAGNVAEWIADIPRDQNVPVKGANPYTYKLASNIGSEYEVTDAYHFRLPPSLKSIEMKDLGMVKGGAFNQSSFYLQPGVSVPVVPEKGYLWVGFRPVISIVETAGYIKLHKVNKL